MVFGQCESDSIAPKIHLNTADTVYSDVNTHYRSTQVSATDNCTPDSLVQVNKTFSNINPYTLGVYLETFEAIDSKFNVTKRNRWVGIQDTVKPIIFDIDERVQNVHHPDSAYSPFSYIAVNDNYDSPNDLMQRMNILDGNVKPAIEGLYYITYQTHDISGNYSEPYILILSVERHGSPPTSSIESVIVEEQKNHTDVIPNPANNQVLVKGDSPIQALRITGLKGDEYIVLKTRSGSTEQITVDLSALSNGVYILRVQYENFEERRRFIVNR